MAATQRASKKIKFANVKQTFKTAASGDGGAAVVGTIFLYGHDAKLVFDAAAPGSPLYQIVLENDCKPSPLFNIVTGLREFLATTKHELDCKDLAQLESLYSTRVVITPGSDTSGCGFVPWQVAFYTSGAHLGATLQLLGGYLVWQHESGRVGEKAAQMSLRLGPGVRVDTAHLPTNVQVDIDAAVAVTPLVAAPPRGKKLVEITVEHVSADVVNVLFTGNTYAFRRLFDAAGLAGGWADVAGEQTYVRCLPNLDISSAGAQQKAAAMIKSSLLAGYVAILRPDDEWSSSCAEFAQELCRNQIYNVE